MISDAEAQQARQRIDPLLAAPLSSDSGVQLALPSERSRFPDGLHRQRRCARGNRRTGDRIRRRGLETNP
jgi:hypothetical protein